MWHRHSRWAGQAGHRARIPRDNRSTSHPPGQIINLAPGGLAGLWGTHSSALPQVCRGAGVPCSSQAERIITCSGLLQIARMMTTAPRKFLLASSTNCQKENLPQNQPKPQCGCKSPEQGGAAQTERALVPAFGHRGQLSCNESITASPHQTEGSCGQRGRGNLGVGGLQRGRIPGAHSGRHHRLPQPRRGGKHPPRFAGGKIPAGRPE